MKLTAQIQLLPDAKQSEYLKTTIARFNEAANWLAGKAFERKLANAYALHVLHYRDLRGRFGLSAQMAARVLGVVAAAYKRDKAVCPTFRPDAAMMYDARLLSFKPDDKVSLLTLQGRTLVDVKIGEYQRKQWLYIKPAGQVFQRKDGKWFLHAFLDYPDPPEGKIIDYIAVDFGVANIATTDDGTTYTGHDTEQVRQKYQRQRTNLQKRRTKLLRRSKRPQAVNRKRRKTAKKEANFRRNTNHTIAKQLVAKAKDSGKGIALEDLTHIRSRTRFRKPQRAMMSAWAFHQLRTFVEYKARRAGVPVQTVAPQNTSRTCSECGHCEKANRQNQALFRCRNCGYFDHADKNAARNIRAKAVCQAA